MTWTEVQRKSKKSKTATSVSSDPPSSSEGSRSSSPNWSPCSSPPCPQLDQLRPPGPTHSTPKPMRPPPGLSEPSGTELKYLPGCLNTVHLNFVREPNAYAKREKDWYNDVWRKDNDWRDQEVNISNRFFKIFKGSPFAKSKTIISRSIWRDMGSH